MVRYVLRDDLSCCRVDQHLVFFDLSNDRYFRLPFQVERDLTAHFASNGSSSERTNSLVERGLLVRSTLPEKTNEASPKSTARSAMEMPYPERRARVRALALAEVTTLVMQTKLELRRTSLKSVLGALCDRRRTCTDDRDTSTEPIEQRLLDAASAFRRARLYVPIEMRCLLDSIAMTKFLYRRRLHTRIVFGVVLDPFSAHCWVQAGDMVLNDSLGNVAAHTPIRVV